MLLEAKLSISSSLSDISVVIHHTSRGWTSKRRITLWSEGALIPWLNRAVHFDRPRTLCSCSSINAYWFCAIKQLPFVASSIKPVSKTLKIMCCYIVGYQKKFKSNSKELLKKKTNKSKHGHAHIPSPLSTELCEYSNNQVWHHYQSVSPSLAPKWVWSTFHQSHQV